MQICVVQNVQGLATKAPPDAEPYLLPQNDPNSAAHVLKPLR